jgi:hypothetical protein
MSFTIFAFTSEILHSRSPRQSAPCRFVVLVRVRRPAHRFATNASLGLCGSFASRPWVARRGGGWEVRIFAVGREREAFPDTCVTASLHSQPRSRALVADWCTGDAELSAAFEFEPAPRFATAPSCYARSTGRTANPGASSAPRRSRNSIIDEAWSRRKGSCPGALSAR